MQKHLSVLVVLVALSSSGCSSLKPILRTAHDVAKSLCALHFSEQQGLSVEEAASKFCETETQLRPWIDFVLKTKKDGIAQQSEGSPASEE